MNKKTWLWALYDFANSLAFINVTFYFALWFVSNVKGSDIWVSIPLAASTIVLLFTLPVLGTISDRIKRRMPFLITFTLLAIVTLFFLGIVAVKTVSLTTATLILIVLFYFLFQYFYQASLAFYHSFVHDLSIGGSKEKLSGFGYAAGQLGNIVGLLLVFPIAQGKISLFGFDDRSATFLVASALFLIFSIPVLLLLKDKNVSFKREPLRLAVSFKEAIRDLRQIRQYPNVLVYLFSYYFFADAILTLQLFASIYLEKVAGLDDQQKTIVFILALLLGAIGALVSGIIARIVKSTRRAIKILIALWIVFIVIFAFSQNQLLFMIMVALNGFVFGALFALSRAFYSKLIPIDKQGKFFAIYVLFERSASILGPLVWSATIVVFAFMGEDMKFRLAMFSLAIFVTISFFIFRFVKEPKAATQTVRS